MRYAVIGLLSGALIYGQSAKEWLDKGLEAVHGSRLAEAQDDFEKAIAADPTLEEVYVQLADVYLRERKPPLNSDAALELSSKAENELRRAIALNTGDRRARAGLAVLLYRSALETKDDIQKAARFDEAVSLFKKLAGAPSNDSKQMYLALAQIDAIRAAPEIAQARTTASMKPDDPRPLPDEARRKELKDKYGAFIEEGIQNAKAALDLDPKWTAAMTAMSGLLRERALLRDNESDAATDWKSAGEHLKFVPPRIGDGVPLAASPASPLSNNEIIADLTEAIQRKPDFATAYYARAMTYLRTLKFEEALPDFQKAIDLRPAEAVQVYTNRSNAYDALKQYDNEIADLTKLTELNPKDWFVRLRRANIYSVSGHCDLAITDYTQVISAFPIAAAYYGRAKCRTKLGDIRGATEDQSKFQELDATRQVPSNGSGYLPPGPMIAGTRPPNAAPRPTAPQGDPLARTGSASAKPPAPPPGVYRIGGGVTQPALLFKIEPEYSEEARKAKWQGTADLSIVVSEFGEPIDVKVLKSLGLGLDEKAIDAVEQWVFKPGRKDGKPVPVFATIQVTFHLL